MYLWSCQIDNWRWMCVLRGSAAVRVPVSVELGPRGPSLPVLAPRPPPGGARPPRPSVSARGQLRVGLRLRRSRCITERKIPPDGGLGLLLFSQGAVPLARANFTILKYARHWNDNRFNISEGDYRFGDVRYKVSAPCFCPVFFVCGGEGRRSTD